MKSTELTPNHLVTELGEVFNKNGNKLQQQISRDGYKVVSVTRENKTKKFYVHRLVALAYIPNPENKPCVNHIDGDKTNNHVSNLEWCTYSENSKHSFEMGLQKPRRGEENASAILTEEQVHKICKLLEEGYRNPDIAKMFDVENYFIVNIRSKNTWKHISDQYNIQARSLAISLETIHWICEQLDKGLRNKEIVEAAVNPKVNKSLITKIKTKKSYADISAQYNF